MLEGVFQALGPHLAATAHLLGFPGRAALLGEERLRVGLRAQCPVRPAPAVGVLVLADAEDAKPERDDLGHDVAPSVETAFPPCAWTTGRVGQRPGVPGGNQRWHSTCTDRYRGWSRSSVSRPRRLAALPQTPHRRRASQACRRALMAVSVA